MVKKAVSMLKSSLPIVTALVLSGVLLDELKRGRAGGTAQQIAAKVSSGLSK